MVVFSQGLIIRLSDCARSVRIRQLLGGAVAASASNARALPKCIRGVNGAVRLFFGRHPGAEDFSCVNLCTSCRSEDQ